MLAKRLRYYVRLAGSPLTQINSFFSVLAHHLIPRVSTRVVIHELTKIPECLHGFLALRGITLLSTLGKLFSRILNNRLTALAETYSVYIEAQAGFREHMCTTDNIFVMHGLITHSLNNNRKLFCSFIDFSKAFDYVDRDVLWFKLLQFGVRGKMLDIIVSMYENVKSQVKINNRLSESFSCMTGVRQGECLSPFLFAIYLNDIEQEFITKGADGVDTGFLKLFLLFLLTVLTVVDVKYQASLPLPDAF